MNVGCLIILIPLSAFPREHALIALIPVLPKLSAVDSKKLVYACFIETKRTESTGFGRGFSDRHFTDFFNNGLLCHTNDDADDFTNLCKWNCCDHDQFKKHGVLLRLFGLPLPPNIISAMCSFLVERLYQRSLRDIDDHLNNAFDVLPYLERFTIQKPEKASIVWDCYGEALRFAINVVIDANEANNNDFGDQEEHKFRLVTAKLIGSCIKTRANTVIPVIQKMYEAVSDDLLPPYPLETVVKKINEAPVRLVDCIDHYCGSNRDVSFV